MNRKSVNIPIEEVRNLYVTQSFSARKIGKIYNCDKSIITRLLRENNIEVKKSNVKFIDLTGKTFGKLKVISLLDKVNGRTRWNCICECGRTTKTSTNNFIYNNVDSCGICVRKSYGKYYEIPREFFYRIKQNADKRNHQFDITIEYIWDLFLKQNRKCALSGLDISIGDGRDYSDSRTASLDRIDSNQGYIEGNLQWIHKKINRMKMDLSDQEFIDLCNIISDFQKSKEYNNE